MYQDVVSEASAEDEEEEEEEDMPRNRLESSLADNLSVVTIKSEEEGVLTPSTPSLAASSRQQQSPDDGGGPEEEEGDDAFDDDASFPYRADIKFALGSGARRARRYCVDSEESVESVSSLGGGNMELDEEGIYVRFFYIVESQRLTYFFLAHHLHKWPCGQLHRD